MSIVVLVKQVPDTWEARVLHPSTGYVDRVSQEPVLDEINERAIEVALGLREAHGGSIYALTMGPVAAEATLRRALALGCDEAIHVSDERLAGADIVMTAKVLAAAAAAVDATLVIAGNRSTDGAAGAVPVLVADLLGMGYLGNLDRLNLENTTLSGVRSEEHALVHITGSLPAVVSVTELSAEARIPNFMGMMKAKKKPLHTYSLDALGVPSRDVMSQLVSGAKRAGRTGAGEVMVADQTAAKRLVAELKNRGAL